MKKYFKNYLLNCLKFAIEKNQLNTIKIISNKP